MNELRQARPFRLALWLQIISLCVLALLQPVSAQQIPSAKLKWLLSYEGKSENQVVLDSRFRTLLDMAVPATQIELGGGTRSAEPLKSAVFERIAGVPGEVRIRDGRYVTLTACMAHACVGTHAFLWIDTVGGVVIGGLEHDLFGAETYNFSHRESLLIYSKQFRSGDLDFHGRKLPAAFRRDFNDWIAYARVEHNRWMANVSRRYLVGAEEPSPYIQFRFVDAGGKIAVLPPDPDSLFDDGKATPASNESGLGRLSKPFYVLYFNSFLYF